MSVDHRDYCFLFAGGPPRRATATPTPLTTRPVHTERVPVVTSTRGPRFVGHVTCPMCGTDGQGVEYHGELMSGAKVHQIAAHTAGMRRTERGQPRCLGSGMRVDLGTAAP